MRVNVKGISGSGKSTFGRELAERLGVPYLEMDAVHHGPNWTEAGPAELQARADPALVGGLLVKMAGRTYDGTVRGRLRALRQRLVGPAGNP